MKKLYNNTIPKGEYIMVEHTKGKGGCKSNNCCSAPYVLPIATHMTLGGIRVGDGLQIDSRTGVLSVIDGGGGGTANNGRLTITSTGAATGSGSFTANQASNTSIVINVPSTLSSYINDAGFITEETDPTVPSWVKAITIANINLWNTVGISSDAGNDLTLGSDGKAYYSTPTIVSPNDGLLEMTTSGIATGSSTFTANQATGSVFNVNVPGTNITGELIGTNLSINSSTGSGDIIDLSGIISGLGTVTSVGLTMPSAFTVSGSPITSSGVLTVTALGTAAQYIRGDGTLATFPTIPTVNNGLLTINSSGIATGSTTFSANQSSSSTVTINVPGTNINVSLDDTELTITSSTGTGGSVDFADLFDGLGTVSSVAMVATGALDVSGSPITSSGTFVLDWTGVDTQYVRGDGSLATFPSATTVNDGILTIGTSGIATGSTVFTANQLTNSSIIINVPPTDLTSSLVGTDLNINSSTGADTTVSLASLVTPDTVTRLRGTASGTFVSGDITLLSGANTSIVQAGNNITISSSNTTYTAGNGLTLTGTVFSLPVANTGSGNAVTSVTQTVTGISVVKGLTFLVPTDLDNYVTKDTEITINGVTQDLSTDRTWTIPTASNLALGTRTSTTMPITNSNGTGVTLLQATTTLAGLMTAADKVKLDGLSNYTLPIASASVLGGIRVGSGLSIDPSTGVLSSTGSGGSVTSVGVSSTDLSVSGSPITTSGVITLNINNNAVTNAKLRDSAGLSVIGRASNTTGDPADIIASTNNTLLRRSGTTLGFGTIGNDYITDLAWTKITGVPTFVNLATADLTQTDSSRIYNINEGRLNFRNGTFSIGEGTENGLVELWDESLGQYSQTYLDGGIYNMSFPVGGRLFSTDLVEGNTGWRSTVLGKGWYLSTALLTNYRSYELPNSSGILPLRVNGIAANSVGDIVIPTGVGSVTSVGLSMPSAFTVSGSPITTSGTLAVTGAGSTAQYIRGDGSLATFPTIPTVNNGTLTLATGTGLTGSASFTANQAGGSTFTVGLNASLNNLNDVSITSPLTGQLLRYNGTSWVNWTPDFLTANQNIVWSGLGDVTGTASGSTSITPTLTISNNAVTFAKMQDIPTQTLIGRYTAGTGDPQSITLGTGLTLSGAGVLTSTAGTVTSIGMTIGGAALNVTPATITSSGTFALSWSGTAAQYVNGQGNLTTFPTIPTVNNATLTLATSGIATGSQTFTANQATNATFTVNVPGTNVGGLTGEWGRVTSSTGTNGYIYGIRSYGGGVINGDFINPTESGLLLNAFSSSSTNMPLASSGSLLHVQNVFTNSALGGYKIAKHSINDDELYYRTGATASTWNPWLRIASKEWVFSVLPGIPTLQQVTTAGETTTIGVKSIGGLGGRNMEMNPNGFYYNATTSGTGFAGGLSLRDSTGTTTIAGFGFTQNYGYFGYSSSPNSVNRVLAMNASGVMIHPTGATAQPTMPLEVIKTGSDVLPLQRWSRGNATDYLEIVSASSGNFTSTIVGRNTVVNASSLTLRGIGRASYGTGSAIVLQGANADYTGVATAGDIIRINNYTTSLLSINTSGETTINNLSGTGTRMVVANAVGTLSTQPLNFETNSYSYGIPTASTGWAGMHTGGGRASSTQVLTASASLSNNVEHVIRLNSVDTNFTLTLPDPTLFNDRVVTISNNSSSTLSPSASKIVFAGSLPKRTESGNEVTELVPIVVATSEPVRPAIWTITIKSISGSWYVVSFDR